MSRSLWSILLAAVLAMPMASPAAAQDTGSISGTLTDAATGEPVPDEYVVANSASDYGVTRSRSDGTYEIGRLPPGDYWVATGNGVEMSPSDYVTVIWRDATSYFDADFVSVGAGQAVTGIDFSLVYGGVVTGAITNAWTGQPIAQAYVSASQLVDGEWTAGWGWGATANGDGSFRIGGLGTGDYRLEVWENEYLPLQTDTFSIEAGGELTIDVAATPAYGTPFATLAGRVCEQAERGVGCLVEGVDGATQASPLGGVIVEARSTSGAVLATTTTDPWGWFHMEELTPGDITVTVQPPDGFGLLDERSYTIGPNEGVWDVELILARIDVAYLLSSSVEPAEVDIGDDTELTLAVAFVGAAIAADPFDVTDIAVRVHLPTGLDYVDHRGDGPFDPATGTWTIPKLAYLGRAEMVIRLIATEERVYRLHAEIESAAWPDRDVTFGDGRGDDHTAVLLTATAAITPPVADGVIAGSVWSDADGDGVEDDDETPLSEVAVIVTGENDEPILALTDTTGGYRVAGLAAGNYRVELDPTTLPDDRTPPPQTFVIGITPGMVYAGADFGCLIAEPAGFPWLLVVGGLVIASAASLLTFWLLRRRRGAAVVEPELSGDTTDGDLVAAGDARAD